MPPKHSKAAYGTTKKQGKKVVKKKTGKPKKNILPIRERKLGVVENFIVVWLDSNINLSNKDYQNSIKELRRIVNSITIFTDLNECKIFLNKFTDEKIFLIISGFLGKQIVPMIEDLIHLNRIYVLCCDREKHLVWSNQYPKIRDVFTNIGPLCQVLKIDIQECENNLMPITILSKDDNQTRNLNKLNASFMYSKLLNKILLEIEHNNQAKTNLIQFCRTQYSDNRKELKHIDEFDRTYSPSSAIEWYTKECFTYTMLNKALRTLDTEIIIKTGFFLRDLHQQILQLYTQKKYRNIITVYRGQRMINEEFEKLSKCKGGLISFNNFLSTNIDQDIALGFARRSVKDVNTKGILFQTEINR